MNFPQKAMLKQFIKEDMNPDTIILIGKDWLLTQIGDDEFVLYNEPVDDCDCECKKCCECKNLWSNHLFYRDGEFDWDYDCDMHLFINPYILAIINKKI